MGFGKKMDYRNSKEVDLDIIYKKVIKNLFDSLTEYELIRADEISGSEIIDVSMYSLLLKADLVIADITTMNENAIYELGIRHALKPFSTIIMMQESEKIPFDLNHCRILTYKDFGEVLDDEEAEKIKTNLHSFIKASEEQNIDSPLYTYLPNIVPPNISDTVTIYLIGEYSAENSFLQDQTYIKRELQASLYNGENNTKNGILGIVLPSMYDKVYKGKEQCSVCGKNHNIVCINDNTTIKEFSYNYYIPKESGCSWSEDERYCVLVKWEDFKNDPETYIDNAFNKRKSEISKKTKVRP